MPLTQEPAVEFAQNFSKLQGKFSYCFDHKELTEQLQELFKSRSWTKIFCNEPALKAALQQNGYQDFYTTLSSCEAAITSCEQLVARTGSIVLSSRQTRSSSVYAPVHICIAYTDQLLYDIDEALLKTSGKINMPSLITLATGPSRTADIEKTLVTGVHGPKEVFCFLVER